MGETPELFNEIATNYDRWSNLLSGEGIRAWHHFAVDRMNLGPGLKILDVGCGTGTTTRVIAKRAGPQAAVVGLDPAEAMLTVGRNAELDPDGAPIDWVLGSGEHLPFDDHEFDRITAQFSLRNMTDWTQGLREMIRVLKVGGELTILEMVQPVTSLGSLARSGLDAITANISNEALTPYQWLGVSLQHAPTTEELRSEAERLGVKRLSNHHWLGDLVVVLTGVKGSEVKSLEPHLNAGPVVWAIDGSVTAFRGAQWINQFVSTGAVIHLVTVVPEQQRAEQVKNTDKLFWHRQHHTAESLLAAGKFHVETTMLEGNPGPALIEYVQQAHAGMLIMGKKHRSGPADFWMSSAARYVFAHASCPVLFVPTNVALA